MRKAKESSRDYIPRGDAVFNEWITFIVQFVSIKCAGLAGSSGTPGTPPEWMHIPKEALDLLSDLFTAWYAAYGLCLEPHARPATIAKNEAKAALVKYIRLFVAQYLMFPPVTDADRASMRLPIRSKTRKPVERPDKAPLFSVRPLAACMLAVDFIAEGSVSKAKPYGYEGILVKYAILDHVPAGPEELGESKLATKTPYKIQFAESDRGKRVYIAVCWVNRKGEQGPWSMIQLAIVP